MEGTWKFRGHVRYTVVIQATDDKNLREGQGDRNGEGRTEMRRIESRTDDSS